MLPRVVYLLIAVSVVPAANAQALPPTPPYPAIQIAATTPADPAAIAALDAFRAAVAAKDEARLAALLAPDFAALLCSADPSAPCAPGRVRTSPRAKGGPIATLRLALCCGGREDPTLSARDKTDSMFGLLDSLLNAGKPSKAPDFGDAACVPAVPTFDRTKVADASKRIGIDASNFRATTTPVEVRARAEKAADVVATIPLGAIVPVATAQALKVPDGWTAFALPSGGFGFADTATLDELTPEALCFKNTKAGWRLAFLVGRQS